MQLSDLQLSLSNSTLQVIIPLLKVLHSLHELCIIHRDIKPENIFFDAAGALCLGDFGLAINKQSDRPTSRVGTVDYMAPEVRSTFHKWVRPYPLIVPQPYASALFLCCITLT